MTTGWVLRGARGGFALVPVLALAAIGTALDASPAAAGAREAVRTTDHVVRLGHEVHSYRIATLRDKGEVLPSPRGPDLARRRQGTNLSQATRVPSTNWAGYVDVGSGFTAASGTWTEPTVKSSKAPKNVATWVGVGGGVTSTRSLVQTGTGVAAGTGTTVYYAWVELITTNTTKFNGELTPKRFPVRPGDKMAALVEEVSAGEWHVEIQDTTQGWSVRTTTLQLSFKTGTTASTGTTAEWVTERPYTETARRLTTLADFGSTPFDDLHVNTGAKQTSLDASYMYTTLGKMVLAYPSAFSTATTGSFTNLYSGTTSTASTPPKSTPPKSTPPSTPPKSTPPSTPPKTTTPTSTKPSYTRIYGATADATAVAELEHQFPYASGTCPASHSVVLATDAAYPDALASAYLARAHGTGTLLTPTEQLSASVQSAIKDEGITQVYVVGGPDAVSTAVVTSIESMAATACGGGAGSGVTVKVTRIWGTTLYETAEKITTSVPATHVGSLDLAGAYSGSPDAGSYDATGGQESPSAPSGTPKTAILASGHGFQDAESASTFSYGESLPLLLTTPATLSSPAESALKALDIRQVVLMGGQLAVSNEVVTQLEGIDISVLRVSGTSYTGTAAELATLELQPSPDGAGWTKTGGVTVARGDYYSDGLAGAVVAADGPSGSGREPLLLTLDPSSVGSTLTSFLKSDAHSDGFLRLTVLGGPDAVTQTVVTALLADL